MKTKIELEKRMKDAGHRIIRSWEDEEIIFIEGGILCSTGIYGKVPQYYINYSKDHDRLQECI